MKFNFDLSENPYSKKVDLTPDEITLLKAWFSAIKEFHEAIPDYIFNAMASIEEQFDKDRRLSMKQIRYVEEIYGKYC